MDSDREYLRN